MDLSTMGRGLPTSEVAQRLGKSRSWVQRAIGDGRLKGYQLGDRDYTVFEADLAAFIAAAAVQGGAA